jgi:ADP-heptose:LPS heptosyltransferase
MNFIFTTINNIFLILVCFFYYFFKKKQSIFRKNGKVLIIQMAKLGDMVCTTPMFRAVKEKYPNCKVFVGGNSINKEVLSGNSDVDGYIILKNIFWDDLRNIKKENFDFACITGPNFLNLAMLYLSGISLICAPAIENGWSSYETKSYKILRFLVKTKSHRMGYYAPREYLKLLEPINIYSEDTKKHLSFSEEAVERVEKFFIEKGIKKKDFVVGISPSAGNKIKKWPEERFSRIADYLYNEYNAKVVIIGGPKDREEVKTMISYIDLNTKIINALGLLNIDELKALISKMNMFISVDTGPIYIAEAFDVPTIDIVGPMDEREQPPIGPIHRAILSPNRREAQLHIMNARSYDYKEARRQIHEISIEMVIEKVNELVKLINK